jgi:hypothetical protein
MSVDLDLSLWPMVMTTLDKEVEEEALRIYLERYVEEVLGRGEIFVSMVDLMGVTHAPSARVRQMVAQWTKDNDEVGTPLALGYAVATSSAFVRGGMTAIHWLNPPKVPTKFVASRSLAVRWAIERMEEQRVPVRPAIHRYLEQLERGGPIGLPRSGPPAA